MARMTSRLEKKERQKLMRQTGIFLGIAVTISLVFIFFILPNFIRILTTFFGENETPGTTDTIPPQKPILSAPPNATASAKLVITGFAEPESEVLILLGSQLSTQVKAGSDGTFSVEIQLSEGENTLTTYSQDAAKNESEITTPVRVVFDATPPVLDIISPEQNTRMEGARNQTITVTGATDPGAHIVLNDRTIFPKNDSTFSTNFFLQEGENKLQFTAVDQAGNETKDERMVTFVL